MTELLQELERKLAELPENEQEAWLSRFLEVLTLESHDSKFSAYVGRASTGGPHV